jgi:hypothetical protein
VEAVVAALIADQKDLRFGCIPVLGYRFDRSPEPVFGGISMLKRGFAIVVAGSFGRMRPSEVMGVDMRFTLRSFGCRRGPARRCRMAAVNPSGALTKNVHRCEGRLPFTIGPAVLAFPADRFAALGASIPGRRVLRRARGGPEYTADDHFGTCISPGPDRGRHALAGRPPVH